jgi:cellulose biosynthesis protein BcsQ
MVNTKPKIIAFFSGKGGAGKTTVTIAMTKILTAMNYPCLLIDFDLATNGSSYFFKKELEKTVDKKGIWELLTETQGDWRSIGAQYNDLPIRIDEKFYFVASRLNLRQRGLPYEKLPQTQDSLRKGILDPLINEWVSKNRIRYILIDCQAGYSLSTIAGYDIADLLIIVTEPDSISNRAAENLLNQLGFNSQVSGSSLSEREWHYLINKLDIRESEMYSQIEEMVDEIYKSFNRLPPLPSSNQVRNAFGKNQPPIDLEKPDPFLFSLVKTMKYIFTEIEEAIETYEANNLTPLYEEYDQKLEMIQQEKKALESDKFNIQKKEIIFHNKSMQNLLNLISIPLMASIVNQSISYFGIKSFYFVLAINTTFWISCIILIVSLGKYLFQYIQILKRSKKDDEKEKELSARIGEINRQYDYFNSLVLARSKKFSFQPRSKR